MDFVLDAHNRAVYILSIVIFITSLSCFPTWTLITWLAWMDGWVGTFVCTNFFLLRHFDASDTSTD